jgi:hypothetical protein
MLCLSLYFCNSLGLCKFDKLQNGRVTAVTRVLFLLRILTPTMVDLNFIAVSKKKSNLQGGAAQIKSSFKESRR